MKRILVVLLVVLAMALTVACGGESDKSGKKSEDSMDNNEDYGDYEKLLEIDEESADAEKVRLKEYAESLINDDFEIWNSIKSVDGRIPGIYATDFKKEKKEIKPCLDSMLVGKVTYGTQDDIDSLCIRFNDAEDFFFIESDIKVEKLAYIQIKILDLYGEDIFFKARMIYVDNECYLLDFAGGIEVDESEVKAKSAKYIGKKTSSEEVSKMFINSIKNKDFGMFYAIYDKEMLYDELNDVKDLAEIYCGLVSGTEDIGKLVEQEIVTSKEDASSLILSLYSWYEEEGYSLEEAAVYVYQASWTPEYSYDNNGIMFAVIKRNGEYFVGTYKSVEI